MIPETITNESQLGAEGTYLMERDPPPVVAGVKLNTVGICGSAVRGPANRVVRIGDPGRFAAVFGGRDYGTGGAIRSDIWAYTLKRVFGELYICRVVPSGAATAEADFVDGDPAAIMNVAASSPGAWANELLVSVVDASDGDADHFDVIAKLGGITQRFPNLDLSSGGVGSHNILQVMGDDDSLLITITKLADGRPVNVADAALDDTAGTDGTVADSDFIGAGKALDLLSDKEEVNVVCVAGRVNSVIKSDLEVRAAAAGPGKTFLFDPDSETVSPATFITEVASYTPSDRFVPCFNHPKHYDPTNSTKIYQQPSALMASCYSQSAANVHPGSKAMAEFGAGIVELAHDLSPPTLKALRDGRVSAIHRSKDGYVFKSGVSTATGTKGEITARRQKDFLILAAANRIENDIKEPNSQGVRDARRGDIGMFFENLAQSEQYIGLTNGQGDWIYDTESLNDDASRALGIQRDRMSIRLIPHNLWIVLVATIDTANSEFFISEVAA